MKPLNYLRVLPVLLLVAGLFLTSCWGFGGKTVEQPEDIVREEAYVPVYGIDSSARDIKTIAPQPTVLSGKIYVWGNLLFQVELLKGIHVINYADRQNPVKIGFISIKGCNEVAVKGNVLISNNMKDLVSIDISSIDQAKEVGRITGAFPLFSDDRLYQPDEKGKYFVCPDLTKGDVIGWKLEKKVKAAYCWSH